MMNNIRAILVDDEISARENLRTLLAQFCPSVELVGEAGNVDSAIPLIQKSKPDLVFLDIEMPRKSGFDLINAFETIDFSVVFVTAYDQYAIKAFEVSAIDYLLKPVSVERLKNAVQKVALQKEQQGYKKRFNALKDNTHSGIFKKIAIPHKGDYAIADIKNILTIEADRMYSLLSVFDNRTEKIKKYAYSKKLSYFENLFERIPDFHRVHRSWIVNTNYMESYSKKDHKLSLKNGVLIPVSKSRKEEFEKALGF